MGEVIKFKIPKAGQKAQGKTLCKSGFHKWVEDKRTPFEVKQGGLVTRMRCARCGITRTISK